MTSHNITSITGEGFREHTADKKVVLLYPWTPYRNVFLAHFLQSAPSGLLYYRMTGEAADLAQWLTAMVGEFDEVLEGFGANLRVALATGNPTQMGEALVADLLAHQGDQPMVLFLDEFDRVPMDAVFKAWLEVVVSALPSNIQLAVNSRQLHLEPWYAMIARGDACVLGTAYRKDDGMFTLEDKPRPQLEVYALGRGHVLVNGQEIMHWDGALPRNLFLYMVDHPLVTRDEIFATFWPHLSVKEATNVFHVTKRKMGELISSRVADGDNYPLTQFTQGFYIPNEGLARHYDVADFLEAVERATVASNDEEEKAWLTQAIALYQGPFLETVAMPWANERCDHLRQVYAQALISMARWHQRQEACQAALGFFLRALKETPEREDVHRDVMRIYLEQERPYDAQWQYEVLDRILNEMFSIEPSHETRELKAIIQARL